MVDEFIAKGGLGPVLWKRLKLKASETSTSWLYELWNEYAYLSVREPLVPASSYYFAFEGGSGETQARRAATIAAKALKYRRQVVDDMLKPESLKNQPLCMKQYDYLFHTCRIPSLRVDRYHKCDDPGKHEYIVVVCNDCYYLVQQLPPEHSSVDGLEEIFERIISESKDGQGLSTSIGYMTLADRDTWAKEYKKLLNNATNEKFLSYINNSAFIVCLSPSAPEDEQSLSEACFLSNGKNRFNDKSVQFIVFKNGKAGMLGEHSMMDAVPTANLCEYILTAPDSGCLTNSHGSCSPTLQPLRTELGESTLRAAEESLKKYQHVAQGKSIKVLLFNTFGKEEIKSLGISPDSFVQMSFQLAYYALHRKFGPVYESVSTRLYHYGRTEAARCLSQESKHWVLLMNDEKSSDEDRYKALLSALKYHKFYTEACRLGSGVDRFLLGLKSVVSPSEQPPPLLSHSAAKLSSHWVLSTSQVYSENFSGYGWSNVVEDGYGLPYNIKMHKICVTVVSSLPQKADPLAHQIEVSLEKMHALAKKFAKRPSPAPKL